MEIVRRIFRMVASGNTLYGVAATLTREGVSTPGGAARWSETFVRGLIWNDAYKPHAASEVAQMVTPEVAGGLNPTVSYGILWFGRRRIRYTPIIENGPDGEQRYRRRSKVERRQREEMVPIPVPDAGAPPTVLEAARGALEGNCRPSRNDDRVRPLSGGTAWCGLCGGRMRPHTSRRSGTRRTYYYRCSRRAKHGEEVCPAPNNHRAERIEGDLWEFVSALLTDPQRLREGLDEMMMREREGTSSSGDTEKETRAWTRKLEEVDRQRSRAQNLAVEGLLSPDELRAKLADLEETQTTARQELEALKGRRAAMQRLEKDRDAVITTYAGMVPATLEGLSQEEQQQIYRLLYLRVVLRPSQPPEVSGVMGTLANDASRGGGCTLQSERLARFGVIAGQLGRQ